MKAFIEALDFLPGSACWGNCHWENPFSQWGNLSKTWEAKILWGIEEWIKTMGDSIKSMGECFRRVCY